MTALRRPGDPRESGAVFGTYTWHGCPCQMPEAPAALLDALDQLHGTATGGGGGGGWQSDGAPLAPTEELIRTGLTPGRRSYDMKRLALRLWRQHGQAAWTEVEAICLRAWEATDQGPDPFPWEEARMRIRYARGLAARLDAADAVLIARTREWLGAI